MARGERASFARVSAIDRHITTASGRDGESEMAELKITRWYEGRESELRPSVFVCGNRGGWDSLEHFKKVRLPELRKHPRISKVDEIEFGLRTEEPLHGALEGLTRVEVIEILERAAA